MKNGCVFNEKLSRGKLHGEDAYPYATDAVVAVADGLGGRGPEHYKDIETGEVYTSAYIGAHAVMEAVKLIGRDEINAGTIKQAVLREFNLVKGKYEKVHMGVTSSMFKVFPTTIAVGVIDDKKKLHVFWCGDSRIYVLSSTNGLIQITKDDLSDETLNPYTNISEGGQMSQYVSLSSDFTINESSYHIENENTLVFAASDGVFDYFDSPMHFEQFLLNAFQSVTDFDEFTHFLQEKITEISGDDVSMGIMFVGDDSYNSWKLSTMKRFELLNQELEALKEKEKLLDENIRASSDIQKETYMFFEKTIKKEMLKKVRQFLENDLSSEKEKIIKDNLSKELIQKGESFRTNVNRYKASLAELESIVLFEIAKD